MKRVDAIAVVEFISRMVALNFSGELFEETKRDFINHTTENEGKPGTGACICKMSPVHIAKTAAHFGETVEVAASRVNMVLDHRCDHHGEKAQPKLWGRHKALELVVSWMEWKALGFERVATHDESTT